MTYAISLQTVAPRSLASVRASMPIRDVPTRFRESLDQVYAAARGGHVLLDGQNIFVYRAGPDGVADIEFGVGTRAPFAPVGRVTFTALPSGVAATTTHWGDYSGLGAAHEAVAGWCAANQHQLAGVVWEVYGHWDDDPARRRTDVFHLLVAAPATA